MPIEARIRWPCPVTVPAYLCCMQIRRHTFQTCNAKKESKGRESEGAGMGHMFLGKALNCLRNYLNEHNSATAILWQS